MAAPGFHGVVKCTAGLGHSKRNGPHALTKGFREAPDHRTAVLERRKAACGAHEGCYSEASCFSAINGLRRVSGSQRTEVAANGADRIDGELEYSDSDGEADGLGLRPRRRRGSDGEGELLRQFATAGQARAPSSFWAQQLSMLLLMGTAVFFLGLACAYLNVRSNGDTTNTIKHLFCSNSSKPGCGAEQLAMLQVLGSLYNHLGVIAGDYDCGDHAHTRRISLEDARDFILEKNLKYKSFNDSLQRIINSTSDLGMRLIGEESNVRVRNVTEVRFLESTHPRMSLSCRIWRACISVLRKALLFLIGVAVVWFVLAYIHYRWRKEEEEVRQVYHMAERITDTLQSHSQRCREDEALPPFLPMENVKNMIIPQHDRARLRRVWERAVAFICKHEPRAKQELRSVGGQDCPVWRWIPSIRSTLQRSQGKIWQGKAFQWDRRTYPSPTPCLKIRNMFDPDMEVGETWHLPIHDAILDRCRDNDGIAHIEVDKSSHEGCVYIKCLAPEHAGKAFKALHGSWFDGKLVTVKYLRLDRYHQRFPHAIHSNSPLHRTSHVVLPSS